jgi:type VI secretion system protein ImpA
MSMSLLLPISESAPSGEDLSSAPLLYQLETLVAGTPETQFSGAQEPDWRILEREGSAFLGRSKHLAVLVIYAVTLLKRKGLEGLAEGLELVSGNVRDYWNDLYPKLDPDDRLDPTERMSILSALSAPQGTEGDAIKFIERLRATPLYKFPVIGVASLEAMGEQDSALTNEFQTALKAEPADAVRPLLEFARRACVAASELIDFLDATLEVRHRRSWNLLTTELSTIMNFFEEGLSGTASGLETSLQTVSSGPVASAGGVAAKPVAVGYIASREDVIRTLDALCLFYAQNEPSSPLPLLLNRCRELVPKTFLEVVEELLPEGVSQIKNLGGIRD